MNNKSLKSIPLIIGFLFLFQIAKGQISYKTTGHSGNLICLPVSLMDTMIHDLKQRKLLMFADSLNRVEILRLKQQNYSSDIIILQKNEIIATEQKKRYRNGVQRNVLTGIVIVLSYLLFVR